MLIITETKALETYCKTLKKSSFITIDTEFLRERVYYPKLCLIQVAGPGDIVPAIIDPLADGIELKSLFKILSNKKILKIMHSGKQDMEIFHMLMDGKLPKPIFDTQIAGAILGYGDQMGYQHLVKKICDVDVDKSNQFTDWSHRPLSQSQLDYAIGDVTHLIHVYEHLKKELSDQGRIKWAEEESQFLSDPKNYDTDPMKAWTRVKMKTKNEIDYAVLQELAAWREKRAQYKNLPRPFVMKDEVLAQLAMTRPKDEKSLKRIRGLHKAYQKDRHASDLLGIIADTVKRFEKKKIKIDIPVRHKKMLKDKAPIADMLKLLLKIKSHEGNIAGKMIASTHELEDYAGKRMNKIRFLKGWRYDLFGKDAKALIDGELSIRLKGKKILLERD